MLGQLHTAPDGFQVLKRRSFDEAAAFTRLKLKLKPIASIPIAFSAHRQMLRAAQ